jgi:hypothetical protein
MDDAHRVHQCNGRGDLSHDPRGFELTQCPFFNNIIEELSSAHHLHHDENAIRGFEDIFEFDNVRMIELRQDLSGRAEDKKRRSSEGNFEP